jgi:hypothetical protein
MGRLTAIICMALISASWSASGDSGVQDPRVIERDIWVPPPPLPDCAVPELAATVFETLARPGGVEYLPGRCSSPVHSIPLAGRTTLRGLSAFEALSRLIAMDPRYSWKNIDGIPVVRPVEAWSDASGFLQRTVSVGFTDQNVGGALTAILNAVGSGEFQGQRDLTSADGNRRFSMSAQSSSLAGVLNAVVRAHGRLMWAVGYCRPQRRVEFARILLRTFDGAGLAGEPVGSSVDGSGVRQDPCAAPLPY